MIDQEALTSIENLHRMKTDGIITEAEFEQSKQKILFESKPAKVAERKSFQPGALPAKDDVVAWLKLPFQRYADFEGRSGRREYWLFHLVPVGVITIMVMVAGTSSSAYDDHGGFERMVLVLAVLALLGMIVPLLALQSRRFHDQDRSGLLILMNLIPYVGSIVVLVMMLLEGTKGDNRFGPAPQSS